MSLVFAAVFVMSSSAHGQPISELAGTSWSGTGQMRFAEGQTENVRCRAYYTKRERILGLALRCAASGQAVDLRAALVVEGGKVSGTWTERSFNAEGVAIGTSDGPKLSLSINGGGLKALMAVVTDGTQQTVSITSEGTRLRAVTIGLAKEQQ
jgi:hypothetical protein